MSERSKDTPTRAGIPSLAWMLIVLVAFGILNSIVGFLQAGVMYASMDAYQASIALGTFVSIVLPFIKALPLLLLFCASVVVWSLGAVSEQRELLSDTSPNR